jgi:hypothetical protein
MDIHDIDGFVIVDDRGGILLQRTYKDKDKLPGILQRIRQENEEVLVYDDKVVIYKNVEDISLFLYSSLSTNEVFLEKCMETLYSSLLATLKSPLDRETILMKYDLVVLVVDSFVYEGVVIEDDTARLLEGIPHRPFEGLEGMQIPKGFVSLFHKASRAFKRG